MAEYGAMGIPLPVVRPSNSARNSFDHWGLCGIPLGEGVCTCNIADRLDAIEAEAEARTLARVAGAVRHIEASARLLRDGWFGYDPDLARVLGTIIDECAALAQPDSTGAKP